MKSMFDDETRTAIIGRIRSLKKDSPRQWGKMTPFQMVQHCIVWEGMSQGTKKYKQVFIGRLFGRMALKALLRDERLLGRNTPTMPDMKMTGEGEIEPEKIKLIASLDGYRHFSNDHFIHPFFGKMTAEQTGQLAYKHFDHHLRQFGC